MTKLKVIQTVALLLVITFIFSFLAKYTGIEKPKLSLVEKSIRVAATPFQNGVTTVNQKITDFFGLFSEIQTLRDENALLKKKVSELNQEINLLYNFRLENERLRRLLDYKDTSGQNFKLLSAKVIARDPSNWYSTVTINRGSEDGVLKNMAVVTHQGLVGRIINVAPNASEVLLIFDKEGAVGGRVWETRETPGVIESKGDGSTSLSMIHLPHDAEIEIGHTIVTSGLGGLFPPSIRIGRVTEIVDDVSGLMKEASIEPFVNFTRLEEVLVILDVRETHQIQQNLEEQREEALKQ